MSVMAATARNGRLLSRCHIDLGCVRKRFVLTKDLDGQHYAVASARARVVMPLGGGAFREMWLVDPVNICRLYTGVPAARAVRFRNSAGGELTTEEPAYLDTHGAALEAWFDGGRVGVLPPVALPRAGLAPAPAPHPAPTEASALVPVATLKVGDPIDPKKVEPQVFKGCVLSERRGAKWESPQFPLTRHRW